MLTLRDVNEQKDASIVKMEQYMTEQSIYLQSIAQAKGYTNLSAWLSKDKLSFDVFCKLYRDTHPI